MKQETIKSHSLAQHKMRKSDSLAKKPLSDSLTKQKHLEELEERLELLMVNTEECLLVVDTSLDVVTYNNKFKELYDYYFGINIKKGQSILEYVQPVRIEIVRKLYQDVLQGEICETEIQTKTPDGSIRFFINKFKPIYDNSRKIIGVFVSSFDITDSKNTLIALRKSEEKYHSIIENALHGFFFSRLDGSILDVNKTSTEMFGYTHEEFKQLKWQDIVVDDKETFARYEREREETGQIKGELIGVHKNGKRFLCEFSSIIYGDSEKQKISTFIIDISARKKAEEELKLREKRFASLVEHGADGIAVLSLEGKPIYISPSIEKVLGFTVEEAMNLSLFASAHPDDKAEMQKDWETMMSQPGVPIVGRLARILHKDGTWRWLEGIIINMLHEPAIGGIVNNFRDVTTKVLAEQEKEFERRDKEALINNTEDLIWSVSKDFRLIAGNKAFIESMRNTTGVMIVPGDNLLMDNFFDKRYLDFWRTIYEKGMEGKHFKEEIYITELLGATNSWIEIRVNPIIINNETTGLACYVRDITQQKILQDSLIESEEKFRASFQFSAIGMSIVDLEGKITAVNESLCQITGYTSAELIGQTFYSITYPDDYEIDAYYLAELMSGQRDTYQVEKRYFHKDKYLIWVHIAVSLVKHKYGEPLHLIIQINDITQRKRSEHHLIGLNASLNQRAEQLASTNAELEQFAYIASHDLQEPLRMVTSFLTQLEKKYKQQLDEKAQQYIYYAVDGASRMRTIILDLLRYSKVSRKEYEYEWVDMNEVVTEVVQNYLLKDESVVIEWEDLPTVYGARLPLHQVMQNLISNAIKYRKKDLAPYIKIQSSDSPENWYFSISDNGIGIEDKFFEKIFVLFQRLHHREEYAGTGIGLAICKKIIENHNGKIWVESEYGEGSTFHFIIKK